MRIESRSSVADSILQLESSKFSKGSETESRMFRSKLSNHLCTSNQRSNDLNANTFNIDPHLVIREGSYRAAEFNCAEFLRDFGGSS